MGDPRNQEDPTAVWEAPWDDVAQRGWQPSEMKQPRPPGRPAEPEPSPSPEPPAEPEPSPSPAPEPPADPVG